MLSLTNFDRVNFPEDFLWGAATSAYQVEGGNTKNQWYLFEQKEGSIENGDRCGRACGHYDLYEEDFDLARDLKHNAHRLGIEWSRLCPEAPGKFDTKEIKHYRKVFEALKERGMKIFLTLHHFTEPVWFAEKGSFTRAGAEEDFARFVSRCAEEYGDLIDFWITYNEPQVAMIGWLWGEFPPEKSDLALTCRELAGRMKGHAAARAAIKEKAADAQVGLVMAVSEFLPQRTHDFLDQHYADLFDYLWNECFIQGATTGRISFPLIGEDEVVPELKDSFDWWGVNYYTNLRVNSRHPRGVAEALPGERVTQMGWTWSTEGYFRVMERFARLGKPIYLTENGIGTLDDYERVRFISEHLRVVAAALDKGLDLRGYLYWSLLDNFEWACGFRPRFGLIEVNYETLERTVKPSARFLAEIIENSGMTIEMIERYLPESYRF